MVSKYLSADLQESGLLDMVQNVAVIIGVLFCMLISRKVGFLLSHTSIALCGAVLVSVSFLIVILSNYLYYPTNVVTFLAECCFGFGFVLIFLSWIEFFGFCPLTAVVMYWAVSSVLTVVLYLLFYFFYSFLISTTLCFTALVSYVVLHVSKKAFIQTTKKKSTRVIIPSSFSKVFLWAGYFVIVYIFAHTFISTNDSSIVTCLAFVLTLILLLIVFSMNPQEVNYALMYRITIVLMSLGLLCGLLFGLSSMVALILIALSYRVINLLTLLLGTGTARLFGVSSAPLYGFVVIAQCIGSILGELLNLIVDEVILLPVDVELTVIAVAIFLLILIPIMLFPESDFVAQWSLGDSMSSSEAKEFAIIAVCDQLTKLHHLSRRERDVLLLLSRGVSQSQIAKDLYIAPGTVRAHIAHIYQKLNLHSKDDLTVFIDNAILENKILNKVD
jgi:DNA-binding CsgD family transcriptional regulator